MHIINVTLKDIRKSGGLESLKQGPSATALSAFWNNAGRGRRVRGGAGSGSHTVGRLQPLPRVPVWGAGISPDGDPLTRVHRIRGGGEMWRQ